MRALQTIALGAASLSAMAALSLAVTAAVSLLPIAVDQVAFEAPIGLLGFLILPISGVVAAATTAVALRWCPGRISTVAAILTAASLIAWLCFAIYVWH